MLQVERLRTQLGDAGTQQRVALWPLRQQAGVLDGNRRRGIDDLTHLAIAFDEAGAQAGMALGQGRKALFQVRNVDRTPQYQRGGDVIGTAVRLQLPEKPLALLGIRQWRLLLGTAGDDGQLGDIDTHLRKLGEHLLALVRRQALDALDQLLVAT
ncbi:hypothetical protein D3C81_1101360 [compost metagenome]